MYRDIYLKLMLNVHKRISRCDMIDLYRSFLEEQAGLISWVSLIKMFVVGLD